jgi:hypothetical protein
MGRSSGRSRRRRRGRRRPGHRSDCGGFDTGGAFRRRRRGRRRGRLFWKRTEPDGPGQAEMLAAGVRCCLPASEANCLKSSPSLLLAYAHLFSNTHSIYPTHTHTHTGGSPAGHAAASGRAPAPPALAPLAGEGPAVGGRSRGGVEAGAVGRPAGVERWFERTSGSLSHIIHHSLSHLAPPWSTLDPAPPLSLTNPSTPTPLLLPAFFLIAGIPPGGRDGAWRRGSGRAWAPGAPGCGDWAAAAGPAQGWVRGKSIFHPPSVCV